MAKTSNNRNSSKNKQQTQQRSAVKSARTKEGFIQFGNQDADKEYDLSDMRVSPGSYVVRHFSYMQNGAGEDIPDDSSSRFQVYEKEVFERMYEQGKDRQGKQLESAFENLGLGIDVIHKPE